MLLFLLLMMIRFIYNIKVKWNTNFVYRSLTHLQRAANLDLLNERWNYSNKWRNFMRREIEVSSQMSLHTIVS